MGKFYSTGATRLPLQRIFRKGKGSDRGPHFTCFTSTKVQILTPEAQEEDFKAYFKQAREETGQVCGRGVQFSQGYDML